MLLSHEWRYLWLGAEGLSSGNKQLPSYQATINQKLRECMCLWTKRTHKTPPIITLSSARRLVPVSVLPQDVLVRVGAAPGAAAVGGLALALVVAVVAVLVALLRRHQLGCVRLQPAVDARL